MAMDFLQYLCDTCNINSDGTSWEYFRQFKQLYSSGTGRRMDTNGSKEVQKVNPPASLVPVAPSAGLTLMNTGGAFPRRYPRVSLRPSTTQR
ncbi:hypothetical protein B0T10DRAFT_481523 [Thelonectria olida]|uniref:Uncharacterized protein n=1 Tax=Thelonectria olida TaxID=1576542 RepID=A0A9P9ASQ5_9HYPO|nr:hypothetical protein B0T10DRAFT_481523 [Thelonectria olida]